tara:strand:- start:18475 stop:19767 length:1293 start_codon:yes stop_codon:yes gene_type:complete
MNTIYIEAFSGLSGNMLLSAFCGLLDDFDILEKLPQQLHLLDGKIEIEKVDKNGINCNYVEVIDLNEQKDHSKHREESHGHSHEHSHSHSHAHSHDHADEKHSHEQPHSHDHGNHRHLKDIQKIIDHAHISDNAKKIAHEIFLIIGKAESKIHDMPIETIHFHEISGVDSIIDIVGNAVLIDKLNISKVICTPVCTGFGMVKTQHGMLPIPAPATAEMLKGIPIYSGDEKGEKVTPTGAAILKYLNPDFDDSKSYTPEKIAYGPGKKDFHQPNVVRVSLLKNKAEVAEKGYVQMETSIDDMAPEYLGTDFQEGLLNSGAIDFSISQEIMKKGRFGIILKIMLKSENIKEVSNYLFENTSTIGVRFFDIERLELQRKIVKKETSFGTVHVKEATTPSGNTKVKPEFEDIKNISKQSDQSPYQIKNKINLNQ